MASGSSVSPNPVDSTSVDSTFASSRSANRSESLSQGNSSPRFKRSTFGSSGYETRHYRRLNYGINYTRYRAMSTYREYGQTRSLKSISLVSSRPILDTIFPYNKRNRYDVMWPDYIKHLSEIRKGRDQLEEQQRRQQSVPAVTKGNPNSMLEEEIKAD
jgi:hypothetical protein